jgi:hypothetical protein
MRKKATLPARWRGSFLSKPYFSSHTYTSKEESGTW